MALRRQTSLQLRPNPQGLVLVLQPCRTLKPFGPCSAFGRQALAGVNFSHPAHRPTLVGQRARPSATKAPRHSRCSVQADPHAAAVCSSIVVGYQSALDEDYHFQKVLGGLVADPISAPGPGRLRHQLRRASTTWPSFRSPVPAPGDLNWHSSSGYRVFLTRFAVVLPVQSYGRYRAGQDVSTGGPRQCQRQ